MARLLPRSAAPDAIHLVSARAIRGFADGFVSVMLASYLHGLGFSAVEIGALVTATLLGSAALTLGTGLVSHRLAPINMLLGAACLMFATGLGFAAISDFWPLMVVAFVGTLNPSAGDVSVFLPVEQSLLADRIEGHERTALFARYNLGGTFAGALGALASAIPAALASWQGWDLTDAQRLGFAVYAVAAVFIAALYLGVDRPAKRERPAAGTGPLSQSRSIVMRLSMLFSLDSFGGGFIVQSLLVLWLVQRFDISAGTIATVFFAAGLLSALSQLASSWLASRIGLVATMVYTHLPSNILLILAAVMPTAPLAIAFLLARMAISQMDVPARQSLVMAVVPPEERAAAASVTNVPRSLASAVAPLLAGLMLSRWTFGWPLIVCGLLKIAYDILLLRQFKAVQVPDIRQQA